MRALFAREALTTVGLAEWVGRYPNELSRGMRQRVGLARALASDREKGFKTAVARDWKPPLPRHALNKPRGRTSMSRDTALAVLLSSVRAAFADRELGAHAAAAIDRIHEALASPGLAGAGQAQRLPVCDRCLPEAIDTARRHSPAMARIADAFMTIEPSLRWAPRSAGGPQASANWPDGHANAMIVGPGGLESRPDMQIGVSLLAPHVRYPDHNHGPEEVYLVLSPGRFQHGGSAWFEPGIGGTLYNEPNVRHAMASEEAPLFALWYLWAGKAE